MPNQRSKDKTYLGGFVEKTLHKRLVQMAKAAGMEHNKFGFAAQLIREALARRKPKVKRLKSARRRRLAPLRA